MNNIKKILVLGSGSLKIGQAGEFDYSGSQCLKALKEEGIETVLVNPNIATVQTNKGMADKIYFLPITSYFVEQIIKKEKPDGIMLSFGGQTALNCGVELDDKGILKENNIKILGTQIQTIKNTENRDSFKKKLAEINIKFPKSKAVANINEGIEIAEKIGYPIMARIAYNLGGRGSGVAYTETELKKILTKAFSYSKQILIEEYLGGWKEIEYEVVRDINDNCITICNMENLDPLGIHTGESIVVAPSQTLTNAEYHELRRISILVAKHLEIVGECNIQFALDPKSKDYKVIEVNARLSRSSALASKATGYPLAFIATKLSLGYALTEIKNSITQKTMACFEPALDYIVMKIPRWDLEKFKKANFQIGSEMKSVGEVMAIGRKFEEVLQKALRMLGKGLHGLVCNNLEQTNDIDSELKNPTNKRIIILGEAIKKGYSIEKIHSLSKIDKWFLYKIKNIIDIEKKLKNYRDKQFESSEFLPKKLLRFAKQEGFSDFQIGRLLFKNKNYEKNMMEVRELRKKYKILPCIKQIDTLAAEYSAKTNYLYLTYNGDEDDVEAGNKNSVMVLGSGTYGIGSSVEFDWCCVNAVLALKNLKYSTIMLNNNPETVSTDHDLCDRLYFEEISFERVLDIYEKEAPLGMIVSMGGQKPNNLALKLTNQQVKIFGTSPQNIDNAEDRSKFSKLCDKLSINQPEWIKVSTIKDAKEFVQKIKYPVLIRPSYVLSGAAMSVVFNDKNLETYLKKATQVNKEHPIVISKFILDAKEIDLDAVACNGKILIEAISEHIENAGIHSGDATLVLPPQETSLETIKKIKDIAKKIAHELSITGPFNIQFIVKDNEIMVIECNLRSSRSFPFISKVTNYDFIDKAIKAMLGVEEKGEYNTTDLNYVGVKSPQFSFLSLDGVDPTLSVEMASTGEVACLGKNIHEAFLKSLLAVGFVLPKKNIFLSTGPIKSKEYLLKSVKKLKQMEYHLYATKGTHDFLKEKDVQTEILHWPLEKKEPNALTYLEKGKIDLVINIPKDFEEEELENDYLIRRKAVDFNISLLTNPQNVNLFVESISKLTIKDLEIKEWGEYN